MVRKTFQTVRAIRVMLSRLGFRGGWIESIRRQGGTLLILVRDDQKRTHRFYFSGVLTTRGLKKGTGFVHGAYVVGDSPLDGRPSARGASSGRRPFRFSLIGEEALVEVTARTLRIDHPEECSSPLGAARPLPLA